MLHRKVGETSHGSVQYVFDTDESVVIGDKMLLLKNMVVDTTSVESAGIREVDINVSIKGTHFPKEYGEDSTATYSWSSGELDRNNPRLASIDDVPLWLRSQLEMLGFTAYLSDRLANVGGS